MTCAKREERIYTLTAGAGEGDWFYPWARGDIGGVGSCRIPMGQSDGALALTGAMNGCAFQASRDGDHWIFYHDLNGRSMSVEQRATALVRVQWNDYAGPEMESGGRKQTLGQHLSDSYYTARDKIPNFAGCIYEYFIIAVRSGGDWNIYGSSLLLVQTKGGGGSYQMFKPRGKTTLLVSFADA